MPVLAGILATVLAAAAGAACIHLVILLFAGIGHLTTGGFLASFLLSVLVGIPICAPTTLLVMPLLGLLKDDGLVPAGGAVCGLVSVVVLLLAFSAQWSVWTMPFIAGAAVKGSLIGWWAGRVYEAVLSRLYRAVGGAGSRDRH